MTKRGLLTVGILFGLLAPSSASAQEWLKDRRYSEGAGVRAGDLEVHPGVAGEVGYDSNWFLRSSGNGFINSAPSLPVQGAGVFRVTPSISLSTLGPQRREGDAAENEPSVKFRAGLSATYREFLGSSTPTDISKQRNVSIGADARVDILPGRPWGAAVFGTYSRIIQPTVVGDPNLSFNRDDVGGGLEVISTPGGGTLDWRFGYQVRASLFEDTQGQAFNNITHEAMTKGRWKFRPRTSILYDATLRFINYSNANVPGGLQSSTPVRARIGINGLITSRFSLLAMVGYGASFYSTGALGGATPQYDSVIGQAEAKWFLSANPGADAPSNLSLTLSSIAIGYTRDFQNSLLGNFYGSDRGYAKVSYFFAGRVLLSLEGGVGAVEYPTVFLATPPQAPFTDIRADGTLYGEYRLTDSFAINLTGRYTQNFSNTHLPLAPPAGGGPGGTYDMSWQRLEAYAGVRWFL